jgi:hypothetical protein
LVDLGFSCFGLPWLLVIEKSFLAVDEMMRKDLLRGYAENRVATLNRLLANAFGVEPKLM